MFTRTLYMLSIYTRRYVNIHGTIRLNSRLVPISHPRGEGLVAFSWFIRLAFWGEIPVCQSHCRKHNLWLQHWKSLTTSAQWHSSFWGRKLVDQFSTVLIAKLWTFNEARGIGRMSPDPLLVGGVWARDYHSTCLVSLWSSWVMFQLLGQYYS